MSYEQYLEAYNEFWELKEKYDKKRRKTLKTLKKKNPRNIPIIKEELEKFDAKRKCVNCNKLGGTIFEITETHLKCRCNADKKCALNIEIKKPKHINLKDSINEEINIIKEIKQDIMAYKLDLLFQNQSEDIVLKEFRRLKELLDEHIKAKDLFQEFYDKQNKIVKLEVEGKEDDGVFKLKNELIKEKQQQLNQLISEFKKNIQLYKKEDSKPLLVNSIEIYKNTILPLQEEIRNLKYDYIEIEKKENKNQKGSLKLMPKHIIHKTKMSIENQMTYDEFKIIKNTK
tara:strand:+ start:10265 stop:11122 length:858 start_codon:yes stop_codon:yes gene_type:complete